MLLVSVVAVGVLGWAVMTKLEKAGSVPNERIPADAPRLHDAENPDADPKRQDAVAASVRPETGVTPAGSPASPSSTPVPLPRFEHLSNKLIGGAVAFSDVVGFAEGLIGRVDTNSKRVLPDGGIAFDLKVEPPDERGTLSIRSSPKTGITQYDLEVYGRVPTTADPESSGDSRLLISFGLGSTETAFCTALVQGYVEHSSSVFNRLHGVQDIPIGGVFRADKLTAEWHPVTLSVSTNRDGEPTWGTTIRDAQPLAPAWFGDQRLLAVSAALKPLGKSD